MRTLFNKILMLPAMLLVLGSGQAQVSQQTHPEIKTGAERLDVYLPLIQGKKLGIFANQTTVVGADNKHLVDVLLQRGIQVVKIFSPEHGFRGTADAGEKVGNMKDPTTGIPIVSLYGNKRAPSPEDLADIDLVLFDVQDVGVRFYTYISSLEYLMNACIEAAKPLLILDRPNPNGHYVDGPVLEKPFRSFVGMQPIPIVHGLTIGEYAMMLAGEQWLSEKANRNMAYFKSTKPTADTPFHLQIIRCEGYTHQRYYALPVKPSPNLPDMQSILLYPGTCFFEGTNLSLGRGTPKPFQWIGHPTLPKNMFTFTPRSVEGAKNPPLLNQTCYGWDLSKVDINTQKKDWQKMPLSYLLEAYERFPDKEAFFLKPSKGNPKQEDWFFNKLAGNSKLMFQLLNGASEAEIRASWEPGLQAYKTMRKKYLLYPDEP